MILIFIFYILLNPCSIMPTSIKYWFYLKFLKLYFRQILKSFIQRNIIISLPSLSTSPIIDWISLWEGFKPNLLRAVANSDSSMKPFPSLSRSRNTSSASIKAQERKHSAGLQYYFQWKMFLKRKEDWSTLYWLIAIGKWLIDSNKHGFGKR